MCSNKDAWRFFVMFILVGGFFLVELIVGIVAQSIALQADAMHMLSDFVALAVGFAASIISGKNRTSKHTYGFLRMEIIGALVNSTYLLAICINIVFEAIERFRHLDEVCRTLTEKIDLVTIVGVIGLVVNIVGLLIFCGAATHGHSHALGGDHGHGHGGGDEHGEHECDHHDSHGHDSHGDNTRPPTKCCGCFKNGGNLNIMAVFLHVAGDALGSIVVIIATFVIRYGTQSKSLRCITDPIGSLIIVVIILVGAIPLFVQCVKILLHTTPERINLDAVSADIKNIPGVIDIQELCCWQLNGSITVVSMHVMVHTGCDWPTIYDDIKAILDKCGVQSSTIQPDFLPRDWNC